MNKNKLTLKHQDVMKHITFQVLENYKRKKCVFCHSMSLAFSCLIINTLNKTSLVSNLEYMLELHMNHFIISFYYWKHWKLFYDYITHFYKTYITYPEIYIHCKIHMSTLLLTENNIFLRSYLSWTKAKTLDSN